MRLFGGLSFGLGRARVGVSRRGRVWAGARGSAGPLYAGALASSGTPARSARRASVAGRVAHVHVRRRWRKKVELVTTLDDGRAVALTFDRDLAAKLVQVLEGARPEDVQ